MRGLTQEDTGKAHMWENLFNTTLRRLVGYGRLNVIDVDGRREGFAVDITSDVAASVSVPVIASGGAGSPEHFAEVFRETDVAAALAASIFHDGSWTPRALKTWLRGQDIEVRT